MYENIAIEHNPSSLKIALLAGGTSGERSISLKSAEGAKTALEDAGYLVKQLDPSIKNDLTELVNGDFDVAFLCLHGKGGEDGSIQGFLQTINLPYTCSGIFGSAVSIDKSRTKVFYENISIQTPKSITLSKSDKYEIDEILEQLGQKVVVKASTEGSSIGVYIVEGRKGLDEALSEAFAIDDKVVIEQYIKGREYTCAVLGTGDSAGALPVIEIIPKNASYDYESKYSDGGCVHICPAQIDKDIADTIQANAVKAHKVLGCEGVSRTDFLVDDNGDAWALETNTVPGMTPVSLLPDAAKAAGITFPDLCTILIQCALNDHSK